MENFRANLNRNFLHLKTINSFNIKSVYNFHKIFKGNNIDNKFKEIFENLSTLLESRKIQDKLFKVIKKAKIFSEEFIYYFQILISTSIYLNIFIIIIGFFIGFSIFFSFNINNWYTKFLFHLNWILSSFLLLIYIISIMFLFNIGNRVFYSTEKMIKSQNDTINNNKTCMSKNYSILNELEIHIHTDKIKILERIDLLDEFYISLIARESLRDIDIYGTKSFYTDLIKYYEFFYEPKNARLNISTYESDIIKSFDTFQNLIMHNNYLPIQYINDCEPPLKLNIVIDDDSCSVPQENSKLGLNHDIINTQYCFHIKNVDEESLNKILNEINFNCSKNISYINNANNEIDIPVKEFINKLFKELKDFYNEYNKFQKIFAEEILKK
jgi:hypothetical protein